MKEYDALSLSELRNMLLIGELKHEYLSEEDYADLIDNEMSLPEPLNEVIDFCIEELDKYEEYRKLENINVDIKAIIKQAGNENTADKKRNLRLIPKIIAAVIILLILTQTVSMAFGFNLFKYIFNWNSEFLNVEVSTNDFESAEPIFTMYEDIESIPIEFKSYIPAYIWDNFDFLYAPIIIHGDNVNLTFYFNSKDEENINLSFSIFNNMNLYIEKDEDYFEEYEKDGITYSIFKNLEYYKVVWVKDDLLYHVNVNLPPDEIKKIADSF